jgi:hypothetical protein
MPFTISHAAAVLPFSRYLRPRRLLSAVVIGSMVPDFGLLLPVHLQRADTHGALALVTFSLPVGLAMYWIFQRLIKTAVLEVLPNGAYLRSRPVASPADIRSSRQWLIAACGIVAGALTHLLWDAFTHEGSRGMRMIPALDELMLTIAGHHLVGWRLMQDLSSLVGLAIVIWCIARALRSGDAQPTAPRLLRSPERAAWICIYVFTALAVPAAALLLRHDAAPPGRVGLGTAAGDAAIAALRGLGVSLLGVSLALDLRMRFRR